MITIENKVLSIVMDRLEIEPNQVSRKSRFVDDLGADSLDLIDLTMKIEDEFSIYIPDEELDGMKTVEDLNHFVFNKVKPSGAK